MAFIEIETPGISINIPDLTADNTIIKRKAELFNMNYNQHAKQLVLQWQVKHYSNDNGQPGEYLGKVIPDWSKETIADNTTMCDASNGYPLAAEDITEEINYMGQYDFFYSLAGSQPITVHPMIIQFGNLVQSWEKK